MAWFECGGDSGGSSHNYSTTEQIVGTWIDGSTLYEKTLYSSTVIAQYTPTLLTFNEPIPSNIEIHNIDAMLKVVSSIDGTFETATSYFFATYVKNGDMYAVQGLTNQGILSCNSVITLQYTKSSS